MCVDSTIVWNMFIVDLALKIPPAAQKILPGEKVLFGYWFHHLSVIQPLILLILVVKINPFLIASHNSTYKMVVTRTFQRFSAF